MNDRDSGSRLSASAAQQLTTWRSHIHARELVAEAARALGQEVRIMPLKGVLLGALGIVHPAERPLRDADILVSGVGLRTAVQRLVQGGFRVAEVPRAPGYVAMERRPDMLWLDLHTTLMPVGLGTLKPARMFKDARRDSTLFGVPVELPTPVMLATQLIANVIKDRVVHAYPHAAHDVAACVRRLSPDERCAVLAELEASHLAHAGALALLACGQRAGAPELGELALALAGPGTGAAELERRLDALRASDQGSWQARFRARLLADTPWLRALAPTFAAVGLIARPFRRVLLEARRP